MAEHLIIEGNTKKEIYENLVPQVKALVDGESDVVANMANISAAIQETFKFLWVGFYVVKQNQLVLGPFQGPIACTRIHFGKGVCGTCWELGKTVLVPNVHEFPGHIACSSASNSEIVVPVLQNEKVVAVLDVDSVLFNDFDEKDQYYLEQIVACIARQF